MKETSVRENKRLLLIDDDPNLILLVKDYLEFRGYEVITAENGREALEVLEQEIPDMIICDVMMPEMDGLTATREIRKIDRWKTLPIIMLTAKAMAEDQNRCIEAGANDYLSKPLDVDKLLSLTRVWMPR